MSLAHAPIAETPLADAAAPGTPRPSRARRVRTNITPRIVPSASAQESHMTRHATALCALDADERDDIVFTFGADLAPDETLGEATFEVRVLAGERDQHAAELLEGDYRIGRIVEREWQDDDGGAIVLQRVSAHGRPAGNTYSIRCTVTTSLDRQLTAAGHIGVKRL